MTEKPYELIVNDDGTYGLMHPTGLYTHMDAKELLERLVRMLNSNQESYDELQEEYLDFTRDVERELQKEYNKSNIPVWKHEFIKTLAYNMGLSVKKEF